MRWRGRRESGNVVDRRGQRHSGRGRKTMGGGMLIIMLLGSLFLGEDVMRVLSPLLNSGIGVGSNSSQQTQTNSQQDDDASKFVKVILAETEDTWNSVFTKMGQRYQPPKLILYSGMVQSACGTSSAQAGPFYCPGDNQVYIDLSFLSQLKQMGAPGDFAFAYVIAHEVGHHIQNLVGIAGQVRAQQKRVGKSKSNALSVLMELQADCLAGVWINHTENRSSILENGDIEEGLEAAAAVGDDRILKQAGRVVHREAFTHGSSVERVKWFKQGMKLGDIQACNTFG